MLREKTQKRKREINEQKNFFPSLVVTILLWGVIGGIILLTSPANLVFIALFFIFLLGALTFTFSIIFNNTKRGLLYSLSIILFLIMRLFGVGNILNLLLVLGITIVLDLYFARV